MLPVLENLINGPVIKVQLNNNIKSIYEGEVYCLDMITKCLVLRLPIEKNSTLRTMKIFPLASIENVQIIKEGDGNGLKDLITPDIKLLEEYEYSAIKDAEKTMASIGKGVTQEAQEIFDALAKTMPCEWNNKNILVMSEVMIKPPYNKENCSSDNEQVLTRVKKVLEGEKKKLNQLNNYSPKTITNKI